MRSVRLLASMVAVALGMVLAAGCTEETADVARDAGVSGVDGGPVTTPCADDTACADGEWCTPDAGGCEVCPVSAEPDCERGSRIDFAYGNGCVRKNCCWSGQDYDPVNGVCFDIPLLSLGNCPYHRGYECWIRIINGADDPLAEPWWTPLDYYDYSSFGIFNDGMATLHFFEMGLTAQTSPEFSITGYAVTPDVDGAPWQEMTGPLPRELGPHRALVIRFQYRPNGDLTRDQGEFVIHSDSNDGDDEWRFPVVGDSWSTPCTIETVRDDCIVGQRCKTEELEGSGPRCEECPMPQDPYCDNGDLVVNDPPGSYLCVAFTCQCAEGDVYHPRGFHRPDGGRQPACIHRVPCDASCRHCETLCTRYPGGGENGACLPEDTVQHCSDGQD